jgi:hypothetical protein
MNNSGDKKAEKLIPPTKKEILYQKIDENKEAMQLKNFKLPVYLKGFICANAFAMGYLSFKKNNLGYVAFAGFSNILICLLYFIKDK